MRVLLGLLLATSTFIASAQTLPGRKADPQSNSLRVLLRPAQPYIEVRGRQQLLNFDLLVENRGTENLRLVAIKLTVFDSTGELEEERELNENGSPPALADAGNLTLPAHSSIDLFQPFYDFDSDVDLRRLHFELFFMHEPRKSLPVPLTADEIVFIDVHPQTFSPPAFCLPLHGPTLVHDGHDFYSHHRRHSQLPAHDADSDSARSPNLYAYDFVVTGKSGKLFSGDPANKSNWLTYGSMVYAPADGTVVSYANDVPENSFGPDLEAIQPPIAASKDPHGLGNYVALQHSDGRVSWFLHLQPGSVLVKSGEHLRSGDRIGKVGFSGDSLFPHLHYTVTSGSVYPSQGVPSYFKGFTRLLGSRHLSMASGQIDTGDIVESNPQSCR